MKVLILDDSRAILERTLKALGGVYVEAADGHKGLTSSQRIPT